MVKVSASVFKNFMNLHPLYFGTGGRIVSIAPDWKRIELKLPLNIRTRNYVGTLFGGSLFSASDPFYMIMLIHILGDDYVVWDKAASIKFKRPGKEMARAILQISDQEIADIKQQVADKKEIEIKKILEWKDSQDKVISEVERVIYIATKEHYKAKRAIKSV